MRGGTANFSVVISDSEITSPIITNPSVLIAMNQPSLDKFESQVKSGGLILVNSTLIDRELRRGDVSAVEIPATKKASELGNLRCANIIMLGRLIRETGLLSPQSVLSSLKEVLPKRVHDLLSLNKRAFKIGLEAV
jgi:2-oxoglutarate ferredoxin oxidoreductase subunit gamma